MIKNVLEKEAEFDRMDLMQDLNDLLPEAGPHMIKVIKKALKVIPVKKAPCQKSVLALYKLAVKYNDDYICESLRTLYKGYKFR